MYWLETRWIAWTTTVLAIIALILAIVMTVVGAQNRGLQDKLAAGRVDLAKAQTFATLDNSLVQLLAKTAAEKDDASLKDLLASNGVTFKVEPSSTSGGTPASNARGSQ